jgi:hypothetical protein
MSTIKILVLTLAFSLYHYISYGQVQSSIELAPGILIDSSVRYGINVNGSYYLKKIPVSIGIGIGYYKNEKRNGVEFDYSYFSNTGIISNLNVNYFVIKAEKGFALELSSRIVNLFSTHEDYTSKYNFNKMSIDVNRNIVTQSNFGVGFSTIFKNKFSNGSALALHLGVDYLMGQGSRLIQSANIGYEIPITRWKSSSVYKPKLVPAVKKKEKLVTEKPKQEKVKEEPILTKVEKPIVVSQPKVVKDSIINTADLQKPKSLINDTTMVRSNQVKEVNNSSSNQLKKEKMEPKPQPIQEVKVEKKEVVVKPKVEVKKQQQKPIEDFKQSISVIRVKGPLNIGGAQYELGDDWNYWKSDNELWFAKHKDKEKWYNLLKSLSEENYQKAKNTLINNAKKVE